MKAIVLDTKKENLEGDGLFLLDAEKIASVSVERATAGADSQKYGIRVSGTGLNYFFHISFSKASKLEADEQKNFLMKLQARLAKEIWEDRSLETRLISEKMGL